MRRISAEASSRSRSSINRCVRRGPSSSTAAGRLNWAVSTRSLGNGMTTDRSAPAAPTNVVVNSSAPQARATCTATNPRPSRPIRRPVVVGLSAVRMPLTPMREARIAGTSPEANAATKPRPAAKAATIASTRKSIQNALRMAADSDRKNRRPAAATATPRIEAQPASSADSPRCCRSSRVRLAPSAVRIATSRARAAARARSRFATFAQATSSTRDTIATSSRKPCNTSRGVSSSEKGTTRTVRRLPDRELASSRRRTAATSFDAASSVDDGCRRPAI